MSFRLLLSFGILATALACGETVSTPSETRRLVEAGWSFGFCLGPCNGRLELQNDALSYRVVSRAGDEVFADNRGRLTPGGAARLAGLVAGLAESLQETYGCPDCADAGAAYIVVSREGANRRSTYEYPRPPVEIAALDGFLKGVMEALGQCTSSSDVSLEAGCSPLTR